MYMHGYAMDEKRNHQRGIWKQCSSFGILNKRDIMKAWLERTHAEFDTGDVKYGDGCIDLQMDIWAHNNGK